MRISPRGDVLEAGDHPQQGRLAAAGGADQHDELAVADGDVDAVDDGRRAEGLADVADRDRSHPFLPAGELEVFCLGSCSLFLRAGAQPADGASQAAANHGSGDMRKASLTFDLTA